MEANVLANTKDMSREEWLEVRRKGIGGSDAAAIAGLNPWKPPIAVYYDKIGETEDEEQNERMYFGQVLEDVVADEFKKRIIAERPKVKVWRRNAILQHPEHEFMLGNIDRRIIDPDNGNGILECKTTSQFNREDWQNGNIPDMYMVQLQHYLAVTGLDYGYFAVLIGGNQFKYRFVERDDELIDYLVAIEKDFWQRVIERRPPEPDGSEASERTLALLYPDEKFDKARLPSDATELIEQYNRAHAELKEAEERKREAANKLKDMLKEAAIGVVGAEDEKAISWKSVKSRRLDTKRLKKEHPDLAKEYTYESQYRRFMVHKKDD